MAKIDRNNPRLILALAAGKSLREAAAEAGVSQRTAQRRMGDAKFRELVTAARCEMFNVAVGTLASAATEAVETLRELLAGPSPTARLGAARAILEFGHRLHEAVDIESRLLAVEEKLNGQEHRK